MVPLRRAARRSADFDQDGDVDVVVNPKMLFAATAPAIRGWTNNWL